MPILNINGTEIFYKLEGSGREVIAFFNGIAMSTDSWVFQVSKFAKNYRLLLHDFRGQGKSTLTSGKINFAQHCDDFIQLLHHLSIDKVHIIGVSYGAETGMYFTIRHPEYVKSLVIATAVSELDNRLKAIVESWLMAAQTYNGELFYKIMTPWIYSKGFYESKKDWLNRKGDIFAKLWTKDWFYGFISLCENVMTLNLTGELEKIKVPTMIVAAEEDVLNPVYFSEIIHQKIPGSFFSVIKGAGHALVFEKPDEFNELVLEFLKKHNL